MSEKKNEVNIWYLARFAKPYSGLVILSLVFLTVGQVAAALDPIWLKKIIDAVGAKGTFASLTSVLVTYFALKLASALFDSLRDIVFAPAEFGIARTLSERLFHHLLALPVGYHTEQKIGGIARKVTRGGRAVSFILDFMVGNILPTLAQLAIVAYFLLRLYQPVYSFITVATVVLYTVFTIWATERRQKFRLAANQADDEVGGLENDALSNIDTVKYFNNERQLKGTYTPAIDNRYKLSVASNQLFALVSGGQSLILFIGLGAILLLAIQQTLSGQLTIGDLVLLTTYIVRLSAPIGVLGFIYRALKDGLADLDGMAKILHEEITVPEPTDPEKLDEPTGGITFEKVGFHYANKRSVLKDIDFVVEPGQKIAFVGPSGAGKSTIVKLLFRFFDPTSGKIMIDGIDLRKLDKDTRRDVFAIVPQEPALFNTTIAENIRFGKPDATEEEIKRAARLASIDKLIETFPDKYDTVVGERGVKLSGGEKQRVAIARAIIRDPKILVFDEATSSLDSNSEKAIQSSIDAVSAGRTTVSVAHRLSTIAGSDRIYVLSGGEIAESGRHEELLAKGGIYAKLWRIQADQKEKMAEEAENLATE